MFCKNCGSEISDGLEFCGNCGEPIGGRTPAPVAQTIEKGGGKKNRIAFAVLILQAVQIGLFFAPVLRMSVPRYGSSELITIRQILYEIDWGSADVELAVNGVTGLTVGLSALAMMFTLMTALGVRKRSVIGHIVRLLSGAWTPILFMNLSQCLEDVCRLVVEEQGVTVELELLISGVLYYAVGAALLLMAVLLIFTSGKRPREVPEKEEKERMTEKLLEHEVVKKLSETEGAKELHTAGREEEEAERRILNLEAEIEKIYPQIGSRYCTLHGEDPEEGLREPVEAVRRLQEQIEEIKRQIEEKKEAEERAREEERRLREEAERKAREEAERKAREEAERKAKEEAERRAREEAERKAKEEEEKKSRAEENALNQESPYGFCHKCGKPLTPDAIFCAKCGAKVN